MNVFILTTGRTASTTFAKACSHILNYSSDHESRCSKIGSNRLMYPENHIEIDNRLSYHLGSLDQKYGDRAYYVYLKRDFKATAKSFNRRWMGKYSIIKAFAERVKYLDEKLLTDKEKFMICHEYVETINDNIELFLKDKTNKTTVELECIESDFETFWNKIGAKGDLKAAKNELTLKYNASSNIKETSNVERINNSSSNDIIRLKLKKYLSFFRI